MKTKNSQETLENQILQKFEVEELEKRHEFAWLDWDRLTFFPEEE